MKTGVVRPIRPNEAQQRQKYNHSYTRFVNYQFSYNSHLLLKKLSENGERQGHMMSVPLYKIMMQIVKLMMMNELQILFFGSTVQEMKWKVTESCLNDYVQEVMDITPKIQKDSFIKKVQLSLLLIAYIVKMYLNEENTIIDFKIRELVKNNFEKMYQVWVQKIQNNFKFNPKNMNRLFKEIDKQKKDKQSQIVDYNRIVSDFFKNTGDTPVYPDQKAEEVPVEVPFEEEYHMPETFPRGISGSHRHISQIGFNRRESGNQFFSGPQGNSRVNFIRNFSQDSEKND